MRRGNERDPFSITICAWCGRRAVAGRWEEDVEVHAHRSEAPTSSSICPSCFSKLAPGVPYPEGGREGRRTRADT